MMQGLEESLRTKMVRLLFGLTIGLAAALLFWQQLMLGRVLLPTFGSVPTVWLVSLVVFQTVLLAAYGVAHLAARWPRMIQFALVLVLVLAAGAQHVFITGLDKLGVVAEINSVSVITALLGLSGASLFLLSMMSPLLQRAYSCLPQPDARDPYFLYSASNFGSFAGLLLFPILLEPSLGVKASQHIWYIAAGCFAVLLMACLGFLLLNRKLRSVLEEEETEIGDAAGTDKALGSGQDCHDSPPLERGVRGGVGSAGYPLTKKNQAFKQSLNAGFSILSLKGRGHENMQPILWLLYAFLPSALSFGATTHLISDIAPMPLLSMVPLALYLLTFVLAFSRKDRFGDDLAVTQVFLVAFYLFREIFTGFKPGQLFDVILVLATFFMTAWRCHRDLAAMRPSSRYLTYYYMMLALGGALGGLVNVFVIPFVLPLPVEFALFLIFGLLPHWKGDLQRLRKPELRKMHGLIFALMALTLALLAVQYMNDALARSVTPAVLLLSLMLATMLPSVLGAGAALMMLVMQLVMPETVAVQRDFFGVKRVADRVLEDHLMYRSLLHGTTSHGMQRRQPSPSTQPLLYYTPGGGLHDVIAALQPKRVGVVGLGTGTVACMAGQGASIRFYDIDPGIETLARNYFTFLKECPAEVVIGDARMVLAKEDTQYDLLLLDAFSSDSIPVHLLTEEMFTIYGKHLAPHGVLVTHISNRYLSLSHVIAGAAKALGWRGAVKSFTPPEDDYMKTASEFAVLSPEPDRIETFLKMDGWKPIEEVPPLHWTDDHISIIPILNFGFGKW